MKKRILKANKQQEKGGEKVEKKQRITVDNKTAVLVIAILLFIIVIVACAVLPEKRDVFSEISEVSKEKLTEEVKSTGEYVTLSVSGTPITLNGQSGYRKEDGATVYLNIGSYLDYRTKNVTVVYRFYK